MAIGFNSIPLGILTPGVYAEIDTSRAVQGVSIAPHVVMIVGQMAATPGSATAATPYRVRNKADAIALFGARAQVTQMVAAYKEQDSTSETWAIGITNPTGVNASGSITWTGTATESGELPVYVGGRRIPVAVTSGMTAAALETAALAAFAIADAESALPVTVAGDTGTGIDFTADADGSIGNQVFLGLALGSGERTPAGFTFTVTAMASGATDPSYTTSITALGEDQYATLVTGAQDATALGLLVTEYESRWGSARAIPGQMFACKYDTAANLQTLGDSYNSYALSVIGAEKSAMLPLPWEVAAKVAAVSALQAQNDPAVAMVGRVLANAKAAPKGSRYSRSDRQGLLDHGVATVKAASDGRLITDYLITTYNSNTQSAFDSSLRPLYRVRALTFYRESLVTRIASKFADFKMADDGSEISGQKMVTPRIMRSEVLAHFKDMAALGIVEGSSFKQFQDELLIERNILNTDRMDMIVPPNFVNAFLIGAIQIQFLQ
jgi:phage tail sheath gpL-like